jgi:preprotein translocase subunit SecF
LQYLVASIAAEKDSGGALRNFVVIVGCFAAGYSSWFVDAAIDKLWRKLEIKQRKP